MTCRVTTTDPQIGRLIGRHRRRKGVMQRELAEAVGVTVAQISRYERGYEYVALERRTKIAEALGIDADVLADPKLVEVTPDERRILEAYRRTVPVAGTTRVERTIAAIEAREASPC